VVGRVRGELEAVGAQAALASPEYADSAKQHLEHLAKTYTMQTQRDVHESMLGAASMPKAATPATPKASSGDSDFGDNVDLF
jgi:hypothetical protein